MVGYNCHWKCSQRRCNYMDICSNQMLRGAKYATELSAQCDFNFLYAYTEGWKSIIWNTSGNYIGSVWWIILFSFKVLPFFNFSLLYISTWERNTLKVKTWGVWRRLEEWFLQVQSVSDELVIIPLGQKLNLEFKNKLYIFFFNSKLLPYHSSFLLSTPAPSKLKWSESRKHMSLENLVLLCVSVGTQEELRKRADLLEIKRTSA